MNGLNSLEEVFFRDIDDKLINNPFCKNVKIYLNAILNVKVVKSAQIKVDGKVAGEISAELKDIVYRDQIPDFEDPTFDEPPQKIDERGNKGNKGDKGDKGF